MQRQFSVSTSTDSTRTDASGHADVVFTVANTTNLPLAAMAKLVPLGATRPEWLALAGYEEREFPAGAIHQFAVAVNVPADAPEGRYPFRLDVINARKSAEDHAESPIVTVEVQARAPVGRKTMPWLAVAAIALLVVLGAGAYLLFRPVEPPVPVAADPAPASTDTTPTTATAATTASEVVESKLVTVPNLISAAVNKAEWELEAAGLTSTRKEVVDRAAQPGTVRMHSPKPGAQVEKGSNVELEVVIAPDLVAVPDVGGATWAVAQEAIKNAGLVPVIGSHEPTRFGVLQPPEATVTQQDPSAGTEVKRGTRVRCNVYGRL